MGAGSSVGKNTPPSTEGGTPTSPDTEKLLKGREAWRKGRGEFYSWLDQTVEDAIEPELEIVDPHHHAWDMRELNGYNLFGLFKQQYYMTDELIEVQSLFSSLSNNPFELCVTTKFPTR